jgi:hypothetical protein
MWDERFLLSNKYIISQPIKLSTWKYLYTYNEDTHNMYINTIYIKYTKIYHLWLNETVYSSETKQFHPVAKINAINHLKLSFISEATELQSQQSQVEKNSITSFVQLWFPNKL